MPLKENNGLESRVTGHPRMAPYFAVAAIDGTKQVSFNIIENPYKGEEHHEEHHHAGGGTQFFRFLESLMPMLSFHTMWGKAHSTGSRKWGLRCTCQRVTLLRRTLMPLTPGNLRN